MKLPAPGSILWRAGFLIYDLALAKAADVTKPGKTKPKSARRKMTRSRPLGEQPPVQTKPR